MKRSFFSALFFLALGLAFASCSIQPVTVTGVQDMKFNKLDATGVQFEAGLKVKNENRMGFRIVKSELDCKMNGVHMGTIKLDKKIKVRGTSEEVHPVKLSASLTDVIGSLPSLLQMVQKKSGNIELTGYVTAGVFIFRKKFPVNIKQNKVPVSRQ